MATRATREHTTPAGGVRSEILYQDDDGNPVDEKVATRAEVIEYDAAGAVLARTYATLGPRLRPPAGPIDDDDNE